MNTNLMTMPKEQAQEKLKAYRTNRHKDAEEEYLACEQAYEALAAGTPLINLSEAIRSGGFDEKMRPRLAVARADRKQICMNWYENSTTISFNANANPRWGRQYETLIHRINVHRRHEIPQKWIIEAWAKVPMIPADVRPKKGQLKQWHILWEVEDWADRPHLALPPTDPYLLKHIGGELYAVIAEWDLTEIERAVMQQMG